MSEMSEMGEQGVSSKSELEHEQLEQLEKQVGTKLSAAYSRKVEKRTHLFVIFELPYHYYHYHIIIIIINPMKRRQLWLAFYTLSLD